MQRHNLACKVKYTKGGGSRCMKRKTAAQLRGPGSDAQGHG